MLNCSKDMSKLTSGGAPTDRYKPEARAVVTELLAEDMVPENKRDQVEELLEGGEPLKALRVAQSLNRRR